MMTSKMNASGPNVHLSISLPAPLRARIDAEAAERKCTRASLVLAALDQRYGTGVAPGSLRPTGESRRDEVLRFAATAEAFTYADAAGATGLEYSVARRYILQLADAGRLERLDGTEGLAQGPPIRRFRLPDGTDK